MKHPKRLFALLLVLILLFSIPYVASAADEKVTITIQVDQEARRNKLIAYLSEQYPDVNFDIYVGRTGIEALLQSARNGSFPDLCMSGNAWGRDGLLLNGYLYDFSETDIASRFYQVYLDNYSTPDGQIYWLPGCTALEGILANKDLFDQYGIALPTDFASFEEVCRQFTELGIRPYVTDYKYDYTCAYLLQCWSASLLHSPAGKDWRISFINRETDTLDEALGIEMFSRLRRVFEITGVTADDAGQGYSMTFNDFTSGKAAMIRQSTNLASYLNSGMTNLVLLPYFGDTDQDNWYFSCPSYGVAMNGNLAGTAKEELALDIVRSMFSNECMNLFASTVQSFTAYNKGITFEINPIYDNITPYIQQNHLYNYLGTYSISSASKASVQAFMKGEVDEAGAVALFNQVVTVPPTEGEVVATFDTGYSRTWSDKGNEAFSSRANTLRAISGDQILLVQNVMCTGNVYAGDYTLTDIGNLIRTGGTNFYRRECTGAEIKQMVALAVSGFGSAIDPMGLTTLPAVSGCTMVVSSAGDNAWKLDDLLVDGVPMADDAVYTFCFADSGNELLAAAFGRTDISVAEGTANFDFASYTGFIAAPKHVADYWNQYFLDGGKMLPPTDYIIVK